MAEHELWSVTSSLFFIIMTIIVIYGLVMGVSTVVNIQHIKDDWANQRCSPMIMPFASFFGHDTKDNFEFCIGKVFNTHSQGYLGSMGSMFSQFTTLLQSIFDSISSLRNVIASLGGGINVMFQEFTDRITNFFFQLRMTAIHIKMLMGRMYAILFSVMYMGMSGISGVSSFTNTYLFSFLNTFCFPGNTELLVERQEVIQPVPIKEIEIGDILLPGRTKVTSTFSFYARGQPMVQLGSITVSTNHYVQYKGKTILAGDHPNAIQLGPWDSDEYLYCLNTTNHTIPINGLTFLDYDETADGDVDTLKWVEKTINGKPSTHNASYNYDDACFAMDPSIRIKTKRGLIAAKDIQIGDELSTGCKVAGVIRRNVSEICQLPSGARITPATLHWDNTTNQWKRYGEDHTYTKNKYDEFVSFVAVPHSQLEWEDGTIVRDYMEVCSPDAKDYYTPLLQHASVPMKNKKASNESLSI